MVEGMRESEENLDVLNNVATQESLDGGESDLKTTGDMLLEGLEDEGEEEEDDGVAVETMDDVDLD